MILTIKNSSDLKEEIFRLEGVEQRQGEALKARFSSPSVTIATIFSMFSSSPGTNGAKDTGFFSQDFLGLISRFIIPLTLNKTIFKHSNFLIKTLVGVISQKASHYISEDSVGGIFHKIKGLFEGDGKSGGILGTIKSLLGTKKSKRTANYPTNTPTQQNALKTQL